MSVKPQEVIDKDDNIGDGDYQPCGGTHVILLK